MRGSSSSITGGGDSVPEELLVSYYLTKKIQGNDSEFRDTIPEMDVCKHDPRDLPVFDEWFFFSRPDRKYINNTLCNRASDQGFYKITGKEREIKARQSKTVIGKKKTLTFYRGRMSKATRTNWVMHEYSLTNPNQQTDFVLCHLKNKSICNELAEPSTGGHIAFNFEDDQAAAAGYDSRPSRISGIQRAGTCSAWE